MQTHLINFIQTAITLLLIAKHPFDPSAHLLETSIPGKGLLNQVGLEVSMHFSRERRLFGALALTLCCLLTVPTSYASSEHVAPVTVAQRLECGEVLVGLTNVGETRFVTGRVLINQPPERVWQVMVNPFEFKGKVCPRMKQIDVLVDKADRSVLKMTMDTFPIPDICYTVQSDYSKTKDGARIDFHRISGSLKDFKGHWEINSSHGGTKTDVSYSMYLDPGFFVPQWIVRKGVSGELPKTLIGMRNRVDQIFKEESRNLEKKTIAAAASIPHIN